MAYVLCFPFQTYCQLINILSVSEKVLVSKIPYFGKYFWSFYDLKSLFSQANMSDTVYASIWPKRFHCKRHQNGLNYPIKHKK